MRVIRIEPVARPSFELAVPGSKSITNRALVCGALAEGATTLAGASFSEDTNLLAGALRSLGIGVDLDAAAAEIRVHGSGGEIPTREAELRLGNAGTSLRFLVGLVTLGRGRYEVDGDERMRRRPIGGLVQALRGLGAAIDYRAAEGFPPLTIRSNGLRGGSTTVPGDTSSQFISSVLLVSPYAREGVELRVTGGAVSRPYIEMTLEVMNGFGAPVERDGFERFRVPPGRPYRACRFEVEADAASANYFLALAAATQGRVRVRGIGAGCRQGEFGFVDLLRRMGCEAEIGPREVEVHGGALRGIDADMNDMPDSAQTLAVLALFAEGPTRIRNVRNLRVKETDRIAALTCELRKLGAEVAEFEDGLEVRPGKPRPAVIETYRDHRMAMSFAVAAAARGGIEIEDPDCVRKSFPDFFERLARAGIRVHPSHM